MELPLITIQRCQRAIYTGITQLEANQVKDPSMLAPVRTALRQLESIPMTVLLLTESMIGKAVNRLKNRLKLSPYKDILEQTLKLQARWEALVKHSLEVQQTHTRTQALSVRESFAKLLELGKDIHGGFGLSAPIKKTLSTSRTTGLDLVVQQKRAADPMYVPTLVERCCGAIVDNIKLLGSLSESFGNAPILPVLKLCSPMQLLALEKQCPASSAVIETVWQDVLTYSHPALVRRLNVPSNAEQMQQGSWWRDRWIEDCFEHHRKFTHASQNAREQLEKEQKLSEKNRPRFFSAPPTASQAPLKRSASTGGMTTSPPKISRVMSPPLSTMQVVKAVLSSKPKRR